ncbi:hypothetical protein Hanom_Chr03g00204141 [Helianthus anomalus]
MRAQRVQGVPISTTESCVPDLFYISAFLSSKLFIVFSLSKMPFLSLKFGQFCDFRLKVCFSTSRSKRFDGGGHYIFIQLVNSIFFLR